MFNKIQELLEGGLLTKEVADTLDTEVSVAMTKLRDENKTLRLENEGIVKSFDEVKTSKDALTEQIKGVDDRIAQAKKDGQNETAKALEDERLKITTLQDSLAGLEKANVNLKLNDAVSRELDKYDIKKEDKDLVSFRLRANVSVAENGTVNYLNDTGVTSSLEDGFKGYFDTNKSRLNPVGDGGSGTGGQGGQGGKNTVSREAFNEMSPTAQHKFMTDNGTIK